MAIIPSNNSDDTPTGAGAGGSQSSGEELSSLVVSGMGRDLGTTAQWVKDALALQDEDAKEAGALGYSSRIFAQLALPYKDPATSGGLWIRQNGPMRLQINPLMDIDAEGRPVPLFPYGKYPRLILPWLTTQVVHSKNSLAKDGSLTIEIADSLREFFSDLDVPYGGKQGKLVREQARRLFSADIIFTEDGGTTSSGDRRQRMLKIPVADAFELWWDNTNEGDQGALWGNSVRLSPAFVSSILDAPIPTDMRALKLLSDKGGPLAMDIYVWMSYRLFTARRPTLIPWEALAAQFGTQADRVRKFKELFVSKLDLVRLVYPSARYEPTDKGLMSYPSPSPIGNVHRTNPRALGDA